MTVSQKQSGQTDRADTQRGQAETEQTDWQE